MFRFHWKMATTLQTSGLTNHLSIPQGILDILCYTRMGQKGRKPNVSGSLNTPLLSIVILLGTDLSELEKCPYLWRGQAVRIQTSERLGEELVSQDGSQLLSHDCLLLHRAVVLQGQDQRVRRCLGEEGEGSTSGSLPHHKHSQWNYNYGNQCTTFI